MMCYGHWLYWLCLEPKRPLKKTRGGSHPERGLGEEGLFTASETFSETDEIVCCVIGIDLIDFAWSPRHLWGCSNPEKVLGVELSFTACPFRRSTWAWKSTIQGTWTWSATRASRPGSPTQAPALAWSDSMGSPWPSSKDHSGLHIQASQPNLPLPPVRWSLKRKSCFIHKAES